MNIELISRTVVPIFLLIALGFTARRLSVLQAGDERALNSYVYYFALPALFTIDLAETTFTARNLTFVVAGLLPVIVIFLLYLLAYRLFRIPRDTFFLLVLTTVFGSLGFFGIPFVMFAFPGREGEYLASLSASTISAVSVAIAIGVLELYRLKDATVAEALVHVGNRLARNPLILSIGAGVLFSVSGMKIPVPLARSLHMLGSTTATVAIFLLGVFLYGRTYRNVALALKLSLLRMVVLPLLAFLVVRLLDLQGLERTTVVLMHSMPAAISLIILSERYDFHRETIASLVLVSSLAAALYLNLWLVILGH